MLEDLPNQTHVSIRQIRHNDINLTKVDVLVCISLIIIGYQFGNDVDTNIVSRRKSHPSPHFAAERNPPNNPLLTSISANRCISGSSRCSGMFGISS